MGKLCELRNINQSFSKLLWCMVERWGGVSGRGGWGEWGGVSGMGEEGGVG